MKRLIKILIFLILSFFLVAIYDSPCVSGEDETAGKTGFNLGTWLTSFFRDHISPVDGSRCPSIPSCSSYSTLAFKKHGFLIGWIMTVDRLIHEGNEETSVSPLVYSKGEWKILDPVENNDFWWYHKDKGHRK
jgi:hypothetical protein